MFSNGTLFAIVLGVVTWTTIAAMMLGIRFEDVMGVVWNFTGGARRQAERDDAIMDELVRWRDLSIKEHEEAIKVNMDKAA